ncbi:O-antigen ligase family protein [Ottowia sp.]|uniref:PglL family O-oligosaccharyltransferase n=1 Tax=Ottowia sp. TaxID=1898956 RepID=UPI0025FBA85C|nr:O-antigen ligase family protein [Ottowia sp.]
MREILFVLGLICLFLGWNLPNHYPLWTTFHSEAVSAFGVCLLFLGTMCRPAQSPGVCVANGLDAARPVRLRWPGSARVWLLVGLVPVVQYLAGGLVFRGDAALGFMYALGGALSIYTGCLWAAQEGRGPVLRMLFVTLVLAAIAEAGLALVQWLRLPNPGWWAMDLINDRPYGNFAQPNLFGLLMVMGMVAATALFEMRVLSHRASYALTVALLGFGVLISESRASLLGLLCIVAFWFLGRGRVPTRLRVPEVLIGLAVGWLIHRYLGAIEDALYLKAEVTREMLEVGPRAGIWRQYIAAILEHPWRGYGFEQGMLALREVAAHVEPARNATYAHNFMLDLMAWGGVPLALVLSGALAVWLLGWLKKNPDAELQAQRQWVFAVWLALTVQSLLEFPFAHTFFLFPAALLAGCITSPPQKSGAPRQQERSGRMVASRSAVLLGALGAIMLVALTYDYFRLEDDFRANRFERGRFIGAPVHELYANPLILDQFAALNAASRIAIRAGMSAEELDRLGVIARRFHLLSSRMDYAKALALNGRMPQAKQELVVIRATYHPTYYAKIERGWNEWVEQNKAEIREAGTDHD